MIAALVASVAVGLGLGLVALGVVNPRRRRRQYALLAELVEQRAPKLKPTRARSEAASEAVVRLAASVVERFDPKGSISEALQRARIPLRPAEYVVVTIAISVIGAAFALVVTRSRPLAVMAMMLCSAGSAFHVRRRVKKSRKNFEAQLPGALTLIASSLSAGHTFLRAIQMMCEESDPPLSEEFAQVVAETRLGDPIVDALQRMADRLAIRDVDWVVQAIRIQQTVGGRLAELLHTLSDFIRARDEVRREVNVLTAEGRMSAWVLAGLAPFLLLMIQVVNPGYLQPMLRGWGLILLGMSGGSILTGVMVIFRMVKMDV